MENKKYETKTFLKRLTELQLKELIMLCGKNEKLERFEKIKSLDDISLHICHSKEEWDFRDYVIIEAYIGQYPSLYKRYDLDDFTMKDCTGYSKIVYDELLHKYLASQFGEEYTEYLFKKRIKDAVEEKRRLISSYQGDKSESGPVLSKGLSFYEDIYFLNNY